MVLTAGNALEVVVGLGGLKIDTHKLVVDLVLDVAEQDEGRDHTFAARRLHLGLDTAVPHVRRRGQDGADRLGRHGEEDASVVHERLALADPVRLAGIAQVFADVLVAVERVHLVHVVLAHGSRDARVEREGHARVTAAEAVCANAALAVFCRFPLSVGGRSRLAEPNLQFCCKRSARSRLLTRTAGRLLGAPLIQAARGNVGSENGGRAEEGSAQGQQSAHHGGREASRVAKNVDVLDRVDVSRGPEVRTSLRLKNETGLIHFPVAASPAEWFMRGC